MSTSSTSPTIRRLRAELKTAIDALADERERMQELAQLHEATISQRDHVMVELARTKSNLDWYSKRAEQLAEQIRNDRAAVFVRHDFEAMTREQLLSFAEGSINEARRKGLIEAEGLAARQLKLSRETDLDLMRGVVKEYQSRIAEVEAELKEAERIKAMTKVDTRPLSEKLEPLAFKVPTWWESGYQPQNQVPTPSTPVPVGFIPFDRRASAITAAAKSKEPHVLNDGAHVTVSGSTGGTYILERKGDVYSCSCPAWRFNREPSSRRTCKHLEQYLGEKAEHDRITAYLLPTTCHCGEVLVRGQCQVHTRNWKGTEKCACGRAFASCKAAYDTISVAQRHFGHQPELAK